MMIETILLQRGPPLSFMNPLAQGEQGVAVANPDLRSVLTRATSAFLPYTRELVRMAATLLA